MSSNDQTQSLDSNNLLNQIFDLVRNIDGRLQKLEATVSERLYDTRPAWDDLKPRIEAIGSQVDSIENRLVGMDSSLGELKYSVRAMNDNVLRAQANIRQIEDRIENLESKAS
jgi:chromosome segregation ATPase